MLDFFINSMFRGYLWEFIAAVAGSYYLVKTPGVPFMNRLFVYLLWLTFLVDFSGLYAVIAYYSDYSWFAFAEKSVFRQNYWLYNSLNVISYVILLLIFISQLNSSLLKRILKYITAVFFLASVINLFYSGVFFQAYSAFTHIFGTLLLLVCIGLYFFRILKSERILNFYKELPFYIAAGTLLWHLSVTPLLIYNQYVVMSSSPEFVEIYLKILTVMNITMYGIYTLGFILLTPKSRTSEKIRSTEFPGTGSFLL